MHGHNNNKKPPIFCAFTHPLCVVRIKKGEKRLKLKNHKTNKEEKRKDQWLT
jgi:hypothetical protein